ncbi:MAG: hypothetical protein ABS75_32370 [Pelagibacterium sp. SCN 63-23]|nr:MAG: hypothetical protein ABS75_32370 [Pelagibacterium sp. SCN 63-23]
MRMQAYVPFVRDKSAVSALPPGGTVHQRPARKAEGALELFYVGGVGGEHYDIAPMLRAVEALDGVYLTLCCRQAEWDKVKTQFQQLRNVNVVHDSGEQLKQYYRNADAFLMWRGMTEYLQFAVAVKFQEALGWGLPVITNSHCEMGDLVKNESLGWTPDTEQDLVTLLKRLVANPKEVVEKSASVAARREQHSWRARAQTVLSIMDQHRSAQ